MNQSPWERESAEQLYVGLVVTFGQNHSGQMADITGMFDVIICA